MLFGGVVLVLARTLAHPLEIPANAPFYSAHHLSAFLAALVPPYNSRPQKLAHAAIVAATVGAVALTFLWRNLTTSLADSVAPEIRRKLLLCGLATALVLNLVPRWWAGATPMPLCVVLSLLINGFLVAIHKAWQRDGRLGNSLALVAILIFLAVATLPSLWRPIDLSAESMRTISIIQAHYSLVLGTGYLLAHGRHLFTEARPYYGLITPLITAALTRSGYLSSLRDWVQFVRIAQAVYLVLTLSCLYKYARGRWVDCILPFALIFPWYHFDHESIFYPNQSGLRLIGVAVATLLATLSSTFKRRWQRPLCLAIGCSFACLANIETGLPTLIGALVYLWVAICGDMPTGRVRRWLEDVTFLSICGVATVALWLMFSRLTLGYWLKNVVEAARSYFEIIRLFGQLNLGGMPLSRDLWPLLMLAHAIFTLVFMALRGPDGYRSRLAPVRAYAASSLIAWFSYYANRPHEWNTSGFYLIYGLLVVDLSRLFRVAVLKRSNTLTTSLVMVFVALGLVPRAIRTGQASKLWHALKANPPTGVMVDGIYLPPDVAADLTERAQFIGSKGPATTYLTSDSFFVPILSKSISAGPYMDSGNEVYVESDYQRLVAALRHNGGALIYIDSPGSLPREQGVFRRFYDYVEQSLSLSYSPARATRGWLALLPR
jgi:hypothetical protein